MNNKTISVILLLASMLLITSGAKLGLPGNYTWPLNSKHLCFAARFDLKINIQYTKKDNSTGSAMIPLNNDTFEFYTVSCSVPDNVHQLAISMLNGLTVVILNFTIDEKNVTSLKKVYVYITVNNNQTYITDYSNSTAGLHKFSSVESLFESGRNSSYRCDTKTAVGGFQSDGTVTVQSVDLENLQVQPFVDDSKEFNTYNTETVCKADVDKNSNLIPIIVGACLAVMVVVVLVAYLIGRRRSRNGYQSV